jgi:hypothetical protein
MGKPPLTSAQPKWVRARFPVADHRIAAVIATQPHRRAGQRDDLMIGAVVAHQITGPQHRRPRGHHRAPIPARTGVS